MFPLQSRQERSSLALASFPEELCLPVWSAQHLSHLLCNFKHIRQGGRGLAGKKSLRFMETGMERAEVTCKCSLQGCHSGKMLSMSPPTRHWRTHTRGTAGTSPQPPQNVYAPRTRALALFE